MKMLLGEYSPNLTDGSRLALPKKLREQIDEDTVILTKGFEPCIFLYAYSDWLNETAKHMENSITEHTTRDLKRYMYSSASDVSIDGQGRLVVPPMLLEYASITKETSLIGAGDHIEIWNPNNWMHYIESVSKNLAKL